MELMDASIKAQEILDRVKLLITVIKVQRTWRSKVIEKGSEIERAISKMHKIENSMGDSWGKGRSHEIKDMLSTLPIIKGDNKVTFNKENDVMLNGGYSKENICTEDGDIKSIVTFTTLVNYWNNYLKNKGSFFQDSFVKGLIQKSSSDWDVYFKEALCKLNNGEDILLWGNLGVYKKIYSNPSNKNKIRDLHNYWKLYNVRNEINKMKNMDFNRPYFDVQLSPCMGYTGWNEAVHDNIIDCLEYSGIGVVV